jgi:hypothetical protein
VVALVGIYPETSPGDEARNLRDVSGPILRSAACGAVRDAALPFRECEVTPDRNRSSEESLGPGNRLLPSDTG